MKHFAGSSKIDRFNGVLLTYDIERIKPETVDFVTCLTKDIRMQSSLHCRSLFSIIALFFFANLAAQDAGTGGLPYNPDSDSNGIIDVSDLLVFLPYYGENFLPEGAIPIELGGTGATSASAARDSLGLSAVQDSTVGNESYAWVSQSLRVQQEFAQGYGVSASGTYAHASGINTTASGAYSNAQNRLSVASATCASAEGEGTTASGTASHSEGMLTAATGLTAHAEGYNTDATSSYSHAEGYATLAGSTAAHAEGYLTGALGLYAHSEGRQTEAGGSASHAEGQDAVASGDVAHAEGFQTIAGGYASHAGGYASTAAGLYSRAVGRNTTTIATASFATGNGTVADQENSTALGQFNTLGTSGALLTVGNGSSDEMRSNAFEIHADGHAVIHGDAVVEGTVLAGDMDLVLALSELLSTVDSLQSIIATMQTQIDGLTGGE